MKFVFEAKASDYDLAAEQEILLRHVSNRKRNWTRAVILCAATVVLCILLVIFGQTGTKETLQVMALVVGVILFQQGYLDYTSGNPKAFLKLLYRGRRDQTYADLNKVLRIEITEDSPAVEIYNEDGKVGEWDFQNLNRVTESDRIFELCRGGGGRARAVWTDAGLFCARAGPGYAALPRGRGASERRQLLYFRAAGRAAHHRHDAENARRCLNAPAYADLCVQRQREAGGGLLRSEGDGLHALHRAEALHRL